MVRFVLNAVGDHELAVRRLARFDHATGFRTRIRHRLLAENVLAGLGGTDDVLLVESVGEHDVDGLNIGVVPETVVLGVGVDGGFGHAVLAREFQTLRTVTRDQCGDAATLAFIDRRKNLGDRESPEADEGEADAATRRIRRPGGTGLLLGRGVEGRKRDRLGRSDGGGLRRLRNGEGTESDGRGSGTRSLQNGPTRERLVIRHGRFDRRSIRKVAEDPRFSCGARE